MENGMLQVRENEISLGKWSGGAAQLRTCSPLRGNIAAFRTILNDWSRSDKL